MASVMANTTSTMDLPPLPTYETRPIGNLVPGIPDIVLSLIMPVFAYWAVSAFFHIIDVYDLLPQYRLHTPAEIAARNRASRWDVFRDVITQQLTEMVTGYALSYFDPPQLTGMEDYEVAVWARRVRIAQRSLPTLLGALGINAASMAKSMSGSHPLLAGALSGGHYPFLMTQLAGPDGLAVPAFATWELLVAKAIYWLVIPGVQLFLASVVLDTWQYFLHRGMHMNKFLYSMQNLSLKRNPFLPPF
jgi:sphinganine C4-monooxygenase